ncbi:MFS general substrate transporter [Rhizodiscina lignyota]|uniref:MFS general substrate transporter n=1 Tax=Rhizodiscina lignyota TaxID=1504668 RepID=A0A9P4I6Y7_9PEZI|nr:MFS general substrate transporter [Rhizodiscina lignyota]
MVSSDGTPLELSEAPRDTNLLPEQTDAPSTALPLDPSPQVPEGGYGWIVVIACAIITWWFVGTGYSWGVIQGRLVKEGVSKASTLSFVGALMVAFIAIMAIPNARIIQAIGAQKTGIIGISLLGLGELLSGSTTNNVGGLFATTGFIMGVGTRLFPSTSHCPAQYFHRKRGLANGIVYAGGGLGGAVISLVMEAIVRSLGPAWTFRIIGFLTLGTGLPAAWMIRERAPTQRRKLVEWSLFRSLRFDLLFFAGVVATFPLFVPPFFLPLFAQSIGLSASVGAALVAAFNFSSALGRIGLGLCCDYVGPINALFVSLMLSSLSMLTIWPVSRSLAPLVVFVVINGAANGGFFATMPTVVGNVFGSVRVTVAMGIIVTGWAGGYLMGGPIAAYLLDAFGGTDAGITAYRPAMYYSGSMLMAATILVGAMRLKSEKALLKKV